MTKKYRIRHTIAKYFDKNPDYCWVTLVRWSLGYRSFWSLFLKNHNENDYKIQLCLKEGSSYCGKCEENGKL